MGGEKDGSGEGNFMAVGELGSWARRPGEPNYSNATHPWNARDDRVSQARARARLVIGMCAGKGKKTLPPATPLPHRVPSDHEDISISCMVGWYGPRGSYLLIKGLGQSVRHTCCHFGSSPSADTTANRPELCSFPPTRDCAGCIMGVGLVGHLATRP